MALKMSVLTRRSLRQVAGIIAGSHYEVIPAPAIEEAVTESVPRDVVVTVTASPTKGLDATLDLTQRLRAAGYRVVPHVSARLVRDASHLADIVAQLTGLGVQDVFVPGGDSDPPVGIYDSALSLLEALSTLGAPFPRLGITGHPQHHPHIDDDVTIQSMWDKRRYASYIVSNLCFDATALAEWVRRVRKRGVTLAMRVGVAGPVDRTRLMSTATKIGVTDAARFVRLHSSSLLHLGALGGYTPDKLLARMAPTLADPACIVEGLHVFTFNQVDATERWRQDLLEQLGAAEGETGD